MQPENEYVLIRLAAHWCNPCHQMEPIVKKALEGIDNVSLMEIDVDKEPDLARQYKVRSIPMLVLLKDGEVVKTMVGLRSIKEVKEFLQVN